MEDNEVCFTAPVNACFPLSYGGDAVAIEPDEAQLKELKEIASDDCYLCKFDELVGEDWD